MATDRQDIAAYLDSLTEQAATHIKLEITGGIPTWRLLPSLRHQIVIDRIRASIEPIPGRAGSCPCFHLSAAGLRFPDGSFKRPDIAIFCSEPPEIDESWEQVPEAVIEIVSVDYEAKDLSINPPWYLSQGVKDVLVVEPRERKVYHFRHGAPPTQLTSPATFELLCGCRCVV